MTLSLQTPYNGTPGFLVFSQPDKLWAVWGDWRTVSAPANLPSYQAAVVDQNGAAVQTYNIPFHDYHARWVHDLLPDDIIRTPQQIFDLGLSFPYGTPGTKPPPKPTNKYTGPTSTAGLDTDMGGTGERPDIGNNTEAASYALRTGDFGPCLEEAKGFDSMPIWTIDEKTGCFIDPRTYPYATIDWRSSGRPDYIRTAAGGQWSMDIGHHPANYVAYLATGKLRYLEGTQQIALYCLVVNNWYSTTDGKNRPCINMSQTRAAAWSLRSLVDAYRATLLAEQDFPNGLPAPLLPSAAFKYVLDQNEDYITQGYIKDPACQPFRYFPDKTTYRGAWQFDYKLEALADAVLAKAGQGWVDGYIWALDNPIKRLDPASGWAPAWQEPYFLRLGPAGVMPDSTNNFPFDVPASCFFQDDPVKGTAWKQAFDNAQAEAAAGFKAGAPSYYNMSPPQMAALAADPLGGGDFINWDSYTPQQLRQVMAMADWLDKLGLAPVRATFPQFDACYSRITSMVLRWESKTAGNVIASRVSIVSGTVPPPVITPPPVQPPPTNPPPTNPPPTGEPPMTSPLEALDTVVATLKADVAAEIKAVHDRISAIVAAAQGGTVIDPAELQAQVDTLNALHQTLTADTTALPNATS